MPEIEEQPTRNTSGENDYALEPYSKTRPIYDASYVLKFRGPSYIATLKKLNYIIDAITELQVAVTKLNREVDRLNRNQEKLRAFSIIAAQDIRALQDNVGISKTDYSEITSTYEPREVTFP